MRLSTKFSDAVHLLAFLDVYSDIKITSDLIAISINTSPVVVRRLIGNLREAGILTNDSISRQPIFTKPASDITLFDIYLITEGHTPLFQIDKDTNPDCTVGGSIQEVLGGFYEQAETAAFRALNGVTLQNVIDKIWITFKLKQANV